MKKIWFGLGAVVIIILLLLQTRFNIFLQLEHNGYAIEEKTVKNLLLSNPDEYVEEDTVSLCGYKPLEYIYYRGNSYYLGKDKKTQIDLGFPLYINGGSGVWFIDESSTLFDLGYEEYSTYRGLSVTDRVTYNPGGERADANEFLFAGLRNGFFVNLDPIKYDDNGTSREVAMNSMIYFTEDYFAYCEPDGDQMLYQICRNMSQSSIVHVGDEDLTYHQLLLNLHIISDKRASAKPDMDMEVLEEAIPTPEVIDEPVTQITPDDSKKEKEKIQPEKAPREKKTSVASSGGRTASGSKSSPASKSTASPGMRPPKQGTKGDKKPPKEKDKEYIKPTVTLGSPVAGVYRISIDVNVEDPVRRIVATRGVQFEYYEQLYDDAGNYLGEKLVYRNYTVGSRPNPSNNTPLTAGNGNILPNRKYRINAYYTYLNEYRETVTESLVVEPSIVETLGRDSLGDVSFMTGSNYMSIPDYYDTFVKINNAKFDKENSNVESIYGIDSKSMVITITGDGGFNYSGPLDIGTVNMLKEGNSVDIQSLPVLEPSKQYHYVITANDYDGQAINLVNNEGDFETCKGRPTAIIQLPDANNKIGEIKPTIKVTDTYASSIKPSEDSAIDKRDLYFVISTRKAPSTDMTGKFSYWNDVMKTFDDDYNFSRYIDPVTKEEGIIHYAVKFNKNGETTADGYTVDTATGAISANIDDLILNDLDLNTKYYAYVIGDFDLNNKPEPDPIYKGILGELEFRTAGLSSLGSVYVTVNIGDIGAHGANIVYTLNTTKTNPTLVSYLSNIKFNIDTANGEEPATHSMVNFSRTLRDNYMPGFVGYGWDTSTPKNWIQYTTYGGQAVPGPFLMDGKFFNKEQAIANGWATEDDTMPFRLNSMTDYKIVPDFKAIYNGKEYSVNVNLTNSKFKTMREKPVVDYNSLLFAGGTLKFKVRIDDPDDTITGNSGHVVTMNIYESNSRFVKAIRVPKNTVDENGDPSYVQQVITGLDPTKSYFITFIAKEYNEGYTAQTYESNKQIGRIDVTESIDISGTIKLLHLDDLTDTTLRAFTTVNIKDNANLMINEYPYHIRIERDGVDITSTYDSSLTAVTDYTPGKNIISNSGIFDVQKGDHTYKLTLYLDYNNNELVLDTMTFTTEKPIVQISSAEEFVRIIKANERKEIKYCVTDNLDFKTYDALQKTNSSLPSSSGITPTFDGEIDFQGFKLIKDKTADGQQFFSNIGPKGEIYNAVFEFSDHSTNNISDEGLFCYRNYGTIHDVIINYHGGSGTNNSGYGLLCRYNAASGIIERFVINSCPDDESSLFTVRSYGGLVCDYNTGIIRYGYVYGDDINSAVGNTPVNGAIYVGGVAGRQGYVGQMYDVYSLVNVVVASPSDSNYGSMIGQGYGLIHNGYTIGQNYYNNDNDNYNATIIGPALGGVNNKNTTDIYYWNKEGVNLGGTYQKRVALESLYDYAWQGSLLGGKEIFDAQPVEVGYYPHVVISDELPEQEYIPLPNRATSNLVDIVSSEFVQYMDETENSALIKFRFSNPKNAGIKEIEIGNIENVKILTREDDPKYDQVSVDGYTELYAIISNPKKYLSQYPINSVTVSTGTSSPKITYDPAPLLYVDFYRLITNTDEWKKYVVGESTENYRLGADIDFANITNYKDIQVTNNFTGKLDGGKKDGAPGYSLKNIRIDAPGVSYNPCVFVNVLGEINGVVVENLYLKMSNKNNSRTGFVRTLDTGILEDVHIIDAEVYGKEYVGALVGYSVNGAVIQDCSVTSSSNDKKVHVEYTEPANTNTDGAVGGLVGRADNTHIVNCFVTDLDLQIPDIKNCMGAGGVVGRSESSALENVYAQGDILARGVNVGGIVGYHAASNIGNVLKNLISRVNVKTYQDMVGGIVGTFSLSSSGLDLRNNMTGVAFGNVACANSSSTNISYTMGYMNSYKGQFYGSDFQLINGMIDSPIDENTAGLLTYEQAKDPSSYVDRALLNMDASAYDYNYVTDEKPHLPHLYYYGTSEEMPFQKLINISELKITNNLINVRRARVDKDERIITLEVTGPAGYTITGLNIKDFKYSLNKEDVINLGSDCPILPTIASNGIANIRFKYYREEDQDHCFDSYDLMSISYRGVSENGDPVIGSSDYSANPVVIPLVMYRDIRSMNGATDGWNIYINPNNAYGNYENYRVDCEELSFNTKFTDNAKIGRLVGNIGTYGRPKITNLTINKASENLIFRLNSEMSNLIFEDCNVTTSGRDCAGIVGSSSADVYAIDFRNCSVNNTTANSYVGLIAFQTSGCLGKSGTENKLVLDNITIRNNTKAGAQFTGGIVGQAQLGTVFTNIEANNVSVIGDGYVGGLAGRTYKASFEDVNCSNFEVESINRERVGGVVGSYEPGEVSNDSGAYFVKVSMTGTPSVFTDGENAGFVQSSTTNISIRSSSDYSNPIYVGGLCGYSNVYFMGRKYNDNNSAYANKVDGIVVKGLGGRIGGLFGYGLHSRLGICENSRITTTKITDKVWNCVGGIAGEGPYSYIYNETRNTLIDVVNHGYIGMTKGYDGNGSYWDEYNKVENCKIDASKTGDLVVQYVGGLVGYTTSPLRYQTVYNTTIKAPGINYVGGIIGYLNNALQRSYYVATPGSSDSPQAASQYVVLGENNVGGIVGHHNSNEVNSCLSNANVEARSMYAGGIDGLYSNNFTTTTAGGKTTYTYGTPAIRYSYFAGSVKAKKYAGGMVGNVGMVSSDFTKDLTDVSRNGGRRSAPDGDLMKTGSANEVDYTYANMCLASTVEATETGAYAFAGNLDGFEGKANRYNASGENFTADRSGKDKPDRTFFWEGTELINGSTNTYLHDATYSLADLDTPLAMALNTEKNTDCYRFVSFAGDRKGNYIPETSTKFEKDYPNKYNVRLISTEDLETYIPYYVIGLRGSNSPGWKGASYNVILSGDTPAISMGSYATYVGRSYLPHIRVNSNDTVSDYLTQLQTKDGQQIKLPIPRMSFSFRMMRAMYMGSAAGAPEVYASDVDKINVEFDELPEYGKMYFTLKYGNEEVVKKLVDKRVYTFDYDFKRPVTIDYGFADVDWYQGDMSEAGKTLGSDYELEDIFDYSMYCYSYTEYEEDQGLFEYDPLELSHHVMTYGDKYYYITKDGVVSGTGSGANTEDSEDRSDPTAQLREGKFRTLYNGMALTKEGEVLDLEGNRILRRTSGLKESDRVVPFITCSVNGSGVQTFWKHTVISSNDIINRDVQILKSGLGNVSVLSATVENVKDSAVLYTKNGTEFLTVLGNDQVMIDMYQGENINAPEDFDPRGICYMTNNFNTTAPFILVEYTNGGIVGYNYMTGEYLFDNSVKNDMSLLDYARVFFGGEKPLLEGASKFYAATSKVAEYNSTPERLFEFVKNSGVSDSEAEDIEIGDYAMDTETDKVKAGYETATAGDNTELRDTSKYDGLVNSGAEYSEADKKGGTEKNTAEANATGIHAGTETGNLNEAGISKGNGTMGGQNGLEEGEESLNQNINGTPHPITNAEEGISGGTASGEGEGRGANDEGVGSNGQLGGNGTERGNGESLGGGLAEGAGNGLGAGEEATNGTGNGAGKSDEDLFGINSDVVKDKPAFSGATSEDEDDKEKSNSDDAISVAGVDEKDTVKKEESGITRPDKGLNTSGKGVETEEEEKSSTESVNLNENLMVVFNMSTGTYEVLDMNRFLTDSSYVSENARLGVSDFAAYGGYATEVKNDTDKETKRGLALYILAAFAVLAGVGGGIYYKKKNNIKV